MANKLTGQMRFVDGEWRVRLSVYAGPGKRTRQWYALGTADEKIAEAKAAKLIDELRLDAHNRAARAPTMPAEAHGLPTAGARPAERFASYARAWHARRAGEGIAFAESETIYLEKHVLPVKLLLGDPAATFGELLLPDVRPRHVKLVLERARDLPVAQQTIRHIRGTIARVLSAAVEDELVQDNVARKVATPKPKDRAASARRTRVVLLDAEIDQLFACHQVALELRIMCLASRTEGGMRTRDITAWLWEMIDTSKFASCIVPRTKTLAPQQLEIPDVLRGPLKAWWVSQGSPKSGHVFPVTKGKRKGEARRTRGVSFAKRLRRALMMAGLKRHACEHPEVCATPRKPCCSAFPTDPLFAATPGTLPVDFHSFRRAFKTGLAEAGVATEHAMLLSGSSDPRTHARYVVSTPAMRLIPAAALPTLKGTGKGTEADESALSSSGTRDSNSRPSAWEAGCYDQNRAIARAYVGADRPDGGADPQGSTGSAPQGDAKGTRNSRLKPGAAAGLARAEACAEGAADRDTNVRLLFARGVTMALGQGGDRGFDAEVEILSELAELLPRAAGGGR